MVPHRRGERERREGWERREGEERGRGGAAGRRSGSVTSCGFWPSSRGVATSVAGLQAPGACGLLSSVWCRSRSLDRIGSYDGALPSVSRGAPERCGTDPNLAAACLARRVGSAAPAAFHGRGSGEPAGSGSGCDCFSARCVRRGADATPSITSRSADPGMGWRRQRERPWIKCCRRGAVVAADLPSSRLVTENA
jgi:hypothetical protein